MTDSSGTCEFPTTSSLKVLSSADDNSDSHHVHSNITKQHRSQHAMCWMYKSLSQRHVYNGTVLHDHKTKVSTITIVSTKVSLEFFWVRWIRPRFATNVFFLIMFIIEGKQQFVCINRSAIEKSSGLIKESMLKGDS